MDSFPDGLYIDKRFQFSVFFCIVGRSAIFVFSSGSVRHVEEHGLHFSRNEKFDTTIKTRNGNVTQSDLKVELIKSLYRL